MHLTRFLCIYSPGNVPGGCKCRPISVKRNLTRSSANAEKARI